MKVLKFNPMFEIEKILKDSKYPLSKNQYEILCEIISKNSRQNSKINITEFLYNLDLLVKEQKIEIMTMKYCKNNEEREKFKVHLVSNKLCFFSNEKKSYQNIDSINLFKQFFNGRTPKEDDEYLIKSKYPILPERIGKSTCSCFIVNKNNDLYISPYRQDTMQHSFIMDCEDILSAGLIYCENGVILYIENRAGHYLPEPDNILFFFQFLSYKTGKNITKMFHKDFDIKRENFSKSQNTIINNKEYGLNFFKFKEKTEKEMKYELQIRNQINEKYFNS